MKLGARIILVFWLAVNLANLTACSGKKGVGGASDQKQPEGHGSAIRSIKSDIDPHATYSLVVYAWESGKVTFNLRKTVSRSSTDYVREGDVTDLTKLRSSRYDHTWYLPSEPDFPADKLPDVKQFFAKYREWEQTAKSENLLKVEKELPNPWNYHMRFVTAAKDGTVIGAFVGFDDHTMMDEFDFEKFDQLLDSSFDDIVAEAKKELSDHSDKTEAQRRADELLK